MTVDMVVGKQGRTTRSGATRTDQATTSKLEKLPKRTSSRLQRKKDLIKYKEREEYEIDESDIYDDSRTRYGDLHDSDDDNDGNLSGDDNDSEEYDSEDEAERIRLDQYLPTDVNTNSRGSNKNSLYDNEELDTKFREMISTDVIFREFQLDKRDPSFKDDEKTQRELELMREKQREEEEYREEDVDNAQIELKVNELKEFVEQSKLYSQIIAEQLLQTKDTTQKSLPVVVDETKVVEEETTVVEGTKKRGKKTLDDFFGKKKKVKTEPPSPTENQNGGEEEEKFQMSIPIPSLLSPDIVLKEYQKEGFEWLVSLYSNGLNGILADEMGLGKTLQTLLLLAFIFENDTKGPFLIVTPLSTLDNWMNELDKFMPGMPKLKYYGREVRAQPRKYLQNGIMRTGGCIVTTYEMIMKDIEQFVELDLKFLIVDEGHRLKNVNCKLIQELKRLQSNGNRLLMTGTPLQNNMNELWTLLNFILPDIFTDFETFNKWFDYDQHNSNHSIKNTNPMSSYGSDKNDNNDEQTKSNRATSIKLQKIINDELQKNLISNLHLILKPFILRRLKKNVLNKVLPPKREYLINCGMTFKQMEYYKYTLNSQLKSFIMIDGIKEFFLKNRTKYGLSRIPNQYLLEYCKYKQLSSNFDDYLDNTMSSTIEYQDEGQENRNLEILFTKIDQIVYNKIIKKQIKNKKIGNTIIQLRQIVDSSLLMFNPYYHYKTIEGISQQDLLESSGKLKILDQLLKKILLPKGHRVLIFSQFYNMLDILEDYLNVNNLNFYRIDGNIKNEDRKQQIAEFQSVTTTTTTTTTTTSKRTSRSNEIKIFLLSTRAGGLGINLTNADSVVLFDSDWNPQVDIQAIDRVHRIGQLKPVMIYRLMCDKTIENLQMLKIMDKKYLEKIIIEFGNFQFVKNSNKSSGITTSSSSSSSSKTLTGGVDSTSVLKKELNNLLLQEKSIMGFNPASSTTTTTTTHSQNTSNRKQSLLLTGKELEELNDRSPESYIITTSKHNKIFNSIKLFESSNSQD